LREERLVETEAMMQSGDAFGARLVAQNDQRRIARQNADDQEDERQDGKQRECRKAQPLDQERYYDVAPWLRDHRRHLKRKAEVIIVPSTDGLAAFFRLQPPMTNKNKARVKKFF
jgi:hypothetical protein